MAKYANAIKYDSIFPYLKLGNLILYAVAFLEDLGQNNIDIVLISRSKKTFTSIYEKRWRRFELVEALQKTPAGKLFGLENKLSSDALEQLNTNTNEIINYVESL
jgi:hypothetical protein